MSASHRLADRETLQRAARILLRDGYPSASEALNREIEAHYPSPPIAEDALVVEGCTLSTCPWPTRCNAGCLSAQRPHAEQLALPARRG